VGEALCRRALWLGTALSPHPWAASPRARRRAPTNGRLSPAVRLGCCRALNGHVALRPAAALTFGRLTVTWTWSTATWTARRRRAQLDGDVDSSTRRGQLDGDVDSSTATWTARRRRRPHCPSPPLLPPPSSLLCCFLPRGPRGTQPPAQLSACRLQEPLLSCGVASHPLMIGLYACTRILHFGAFWHSPACSTPRTSAVGTCPGLAGRVRMVRLLLRLSHAAPPHTIWCPPHQLFIRRFECCCLIVRVGGAACGVRGEGCDVVGE